MDFPENPGATRQPGFLIGPSRSSPHCGRLAELSTKASSLQGRGLLLWYFSQHTALIGVPDRRMHAAVWEGASESLQTSFLVVARAAGAVRRRGGHQAGFLPDRDRSPERWFCEKLEIRRKKAGQQW